MDACFFAGVPVDWESVEIWGLNMLACCGVSSMAAT
jgi:hypothetical protein